MWATSASSIISPNRANPFFSLNKRDELDLEKKRRGDARGLGCGDVGPYAREITWSKNVWGSDLMMKVNHDNVSPAPLFHHQQTATKATRERESCQWTNTAWLINSWTFEIEKNKDQNLLNYHCLLILVFPLIHTITWYHTMWGRSSFSWNHLKDNLPPQPLSPPTTGTR